MSKLFSLHNKEYIIQQGFFYSLLFVAISIFSPKIIVFNIATIALFIFWVLDGKFKLKTKRILNDPVAILFILLFIVYVIGFFYTENTEEGFKSIETKAPLLLFPIVIGSYNLNKDYIYKVLLYFAIACTLFSAIALLYQINVVREKQDFNYFFNDGLVAIMDKKAVYYAIYVSFSILIFLNLILYKFSSISRISKILSIIAVVFLLLILFLLAARTSQVVLLSILVTTLVGLGVKSGKIIHAAVLITTLVGFIVVLSVLFPQTISRFKNLRNLSYDFSNKEDIYHFSGADNDAQWNGINLRLAKWVCAVDVIRENPVRGVGSGDVKDAMVASYKKRGFLYAAENKFDPHNQFLDTTVGVGLIGLIILLLCYFVPLLLAIKWRSWLLTTFLLLIIFSSFTESILSRAQGITFYCFFIFLLLQYSLPGKYPKRITN
ncbi:O-antigen ligase family protein [uncultured Pontibacter sp.]|uniref:O-antigen ligase family protein n=1 Tax=uncultured Pontibacter sp. TaxID=453356 RepID=UPI0026265237|nr:O-antigen ligase family protein [uncultured Pontibacter sp.]